MVAQTLGFILLVAVVLFGAAGRIDIPLFWAYLGVLAAVSTAGLFLIDEDLARERMRPGGRPPGLRLYFIFLLCVAHWTVAGLDRRFHWSDTVPLSLRIAALAVFAAGLALFIWAMHVNRFFSSVVRIQQDRGHQTSPPALIVGCAIPGMPARSPQSWRAASPSAHGSPRRSAALGVPLLLWRTILEDLTLRLELPGYAEYAQQVRWRLLPGVGECRRKSASPGPVAPPRPGRLTRTSELPWSTRGPRRQQNVDPGVPASRRPSFDSNRSGAARRRPDPPQSGMA